MGNNSKILIRLSIQAHLIVLLIFLSLNKIYPQQSRNVNHAFHNAFVFSLEGGVTFPHTDYQKDKIGYSARLSGEYFFKTNSIHLFGLKLKLVTEQVGGEDSRMTISSQDGTRQIPPTFLTDIYSVGIAATYSISFNNVFFPYVSFGFANLWFDPKDGSGNPTSGNTSNLYSKNVNAYNIEVGAKYLVSYKVSINVSVNPTLPLTDYLDDVAAAYSKDAYTSLLVGISYSPFVSADADNDGIIGSKDFCPDEAEDFDGFQDEDGCLDNDNDGDKVLDLNDSCPNEAEDIDNYRDTDGCPEDDNDLDSILDLKDLCPNEAEDIDSFEDEDGCPDKDNDADGILDLIDNCPNEAEDLNGVNDEDGCPDGVGVIGTDGYYLLADEIFSPNSSKIKIEGKKYLDDLMAIIQQSSNKKWRIEGHMDSSGDTRFLRTLSLERAKAVLEYFTYFGGLKRENFKVFGLGDKNPVADNKTEEGRKRNRRVEIVAE